MVRSLCRFQVYYHVRQVLKNAIDNFYHGEGLFNLCEGYGVPHDPMRYWDEKIY